MIPYFIFIQSKYPTLYILYHLLKQPVFLHQFWSEAKLPSDSLNLDDIYSISFDEVLLLKAGLKYARESCTAMRVFII